MYESPEARARLRRRLEHCPADKTSPVSINAGLELLDLVDKQEKMINWLALQLSRLGNSIINGCPEVERSIGVCLEKHDSCAACWREAARKTVEEQCKK